MSVTVSLGRESWLLVLGVAFLSQFLFLTVQLYKWVHVMLCVTCVYKIM